MPRALSWLIVASAFLGGVYARDFTERPKTVTPRKVSEVALAGAPEPAGALKETIGVAQGSPLMTKGDGTTAAADPDVITPLNARDPSAMVMGPPLDGTGGVCPADPPCECSKDSLHRYQPKAPRRKDLKSKTLPPAKERKS